MLKFKKVWPFYTRWEIHLLLILGIIFCRSPVAEAQDEGSYGTLIGKFAHPSGQTDHKVGGTVYAADKNILFISDFTYDGTAPAAYFWIGAKGGKTDRPSKAGTSIPYPEGSTDPLSSKFEGVRIFLTLPAGRKVVNDIRYLSIWCMNVDTSFGHVTVKANLKIELPPVLIEPFNTSSDKLVQNGKVKLVTSVVAKIPGFTFDGVENPGTFILAGNASTMDETTGTKVAMMEGGQAEALRKYKVQEIMVALMGEQTFFNTKWLIVYQIANRTNFGTLKIPPKENLKDLQISTGKLKEIARASPTTTAGILTCLSVLITAISASSCSGGLRFF